MRESVRSRGQAGCVLRIEVIMKMPKKNTKGRGGGGTVGDWGVWVVGGVRSAKN